MQTNLLGIRPDMKGHASLEKRFVQFLNEKGFDNFDGTYHNQCNKGLSQAIRNRTTATTLAVRGRADRIAVHRSIENLVFEWDAKSHVSTEYQDATVEAYPLAQHVVNSRFGQAMLYVMTDAQGMDRSFWSSHVPTIREIHIPARWNPSQTRMFQEVFSDVFRGVPIKVNSKSKGSGDPFAIIDARHVRQLPDWHGVIDQLIKWHSRRQ